MKCVGVERFLFLFFLYLYNPQEEKNWTVASNQDFCYKNKSQVERLLKKHILIMIILNLTQETRPESPSVPMKLKLDED